MNRNVTITIIILVFVVIAGYLVWLRSRYQPPVSPKAEDQIQLAQPTPSASPSVTPAASPLGKEATGSTQQKISTPGATKR